MGEFGPKFPAALKKEHYKFTETESYMWKHFTRTWEGKRVFDYPGVESTVNVIWCMEDNCKDDNISDGVIIKTHYEFINTFMSQNYDFFWPGNLRKTQDLIGIVKHNTLCDIQAKTTRSKSVGYGERS